MLSLTYGGNLMFIHIALTMGVIKAAAPQPKLWRKMSTGWFDLTSLASINANYLR
jgi:hypothetical protein